MKTYNVLTITPFFPPDKGGLSYHVFNLNTNLINQGNSVSIVATKHLGNKISELDIGSKLYMRINSIYLPGWPYPTLRSFGIPVDLGNKVDSIIRKGSFDVVHVHGHHYPISWFAINSAQKYGIPLVLTLHGMYALNPKVLGGKSKVEDYFNKFIFKKYISKTKTVIGLTDQITNYAKLYGNNTLKYFTIPNGVNTSIFQDNLKRKSTYREKFHLCQNSLVLLFVGRFEQVKGIIEFANAAKNIIKNEKVEIIIVGAGSLESQVRSIVNGNSRIHLLSWQPYEKIHELYIASDIFVIPSRFEALPLTMIEAMNAGLHIVYTPVGGMPDILMGYTPKTLLNKVSTEEIQNVLADLVSNFSLTGLEESLTYAKQFDWKKIALQTSKVYSECIS